jgi:threonine/homoserine/homoserine lactone efflux protein
MTAFLLIAALLTVTPGADMALVTRTALAGGRRAALGTILGICLGCAVHALASSFGLSLVRQRSPEAFSVVQALGAGYLVWLGVQALREALLHAETPDASSSRAGGFAAGLLTNLLNPKVAAFYLGFLPQFVPKDANALAFCLMLASIHIAMGLAWLLVYASAVERLAAALGTSRVRRRLQAVTGVALLGLGLRLALAERSR